MNARRIKTRTTVKPVIQTIRAKTPCLVCGGKPVDWHRREHEAKPHRRVSSMVAGGYPLKSVLEEIEQCEALCRSCHMKEDGRLTELHRNKPNLPGASRPAKPCEWCSRPAKPLRRGLCPRCYGRKPPESSKEPKKMRRGPRI